MSNYIDQLDALGQAARPKLVEGDFVRRDGTRTSETLSVDQVAVNRLTGAALALWDELIEVVNAAAWVHTPEDFHLNGSSECLLCRALAELQAKVEEKFG